MNSEIASAILAIIIGYVIATIFRKAILPLIYKKKTKEIEKNPKWITSRINDKYYGFSDIDFILAENPLGGLPRFRLAKDHKRLELLIPNDTQIRDLDAIAKVALAGKIKIKYGVFYPDKPIHWLSILCFMLDGGDVSMGARFERKTDENEV